MKLFVLIVTLLTLSSCQASEDKKNNVLGKDIVSKKYFVKGMTCGGCILGVKTALGKSELLKIIDKDIEVGQATLQFEKIAIRLLR